MNRALTFLAAVLCLWAPPAAHGADETTNKAKEHYVSGQTHYALGEFGEAVTEFREAYRLKNEPAILFNIAQAMRQLNNYKQAYFYYSQYLSRKPEASNRSEVEGFMEAMHRKMEADEEADKARAQAEAARPPAPRSPEDHLEDAGSAAAPAGAAPGAVAGKGAPPPVKGAVSTAATGKRAGVIAKAAPAPTQKASPATTPVEPRSAPQVASKPAERAELSAAAPAEALQTTAVAPRAAAGGWATPAHIAGVSALGVGAVAGALAFVFHSSAQAASDSLDQKYANHTLSPADTSLKDSVKSKGALATVSLIGCAVLLVAGASLTFVF